MSGKRAREHRRRQRNHDSVGEGAALRQSAAEAVFAAWMQDALEHLMAAGATQQQAMHDLPGTMQFLIATHGREQLFHVVGVMAGIESAA